MAETDNLYATFQITVAKAQIPWSHSSGSAKTEIQVPRDILLMLDLGTVFRGMLSVALAEFDAAVGRGGEDDDG